MAGPADSDQVASLSGIAVRRESGRSGSKHGDITETLAAIPLKPVRVLSEDRFPLDTGAEPLRDVTPSNSRQPASILEFWQNLRGARAMPSRDSLKPSQLNPQWGNLVLFQCAAEQLLPDAAFSTALRANQAGTAPGPGNSPEATALLSEWMLKVARKTVTSGTPTRERSHVESIGGRIEYELTCMPFGENGSREPDHVLCQLAPVT